MNPAGMSYLALKLRGGTPSAPGTSRGDAYDWMDHAACVGYDVNIFYPGQGEPLDEALRICGVCPVVEECLLFALESEAASPSLVYGVWGATSAVERQQLLRRKGKRMDVRRCPQCNVSIRANALPRHLRFAHDDPPRCGTERGYHAHRRRGSEPCADCRSAASRATITRRRAQKQTSA